MIASASDLYLQLFCGTMEWSDALLCKIVYYYLQPYEAPSAFDNRLP